MNLALELLLRSSALLSAGLVTASLARRSSAAVRHRVLTAAMVASLLMPLLSPVSPRWNLPWTPDGDAPPVAMERGPEGIPVAGARPAVASDATVAERSRPLSGGQLVGAVWITGVLLLMSPLVAGLVRLRRLALESAPDASAWTEDARRIGRQLGLRRDFRVLRGRRPDLLVAWGWRCPTVLVPLGAADWSAERRHVVLAHELAHLVRGDWAMQLAADVARAIYWFNPLAWVVGRRLRLESECACDDQVLSQGVLATVYASHLVAIARDLHARRLSALPAPAMARPTSLEGRIHAMLTPSRDRRPVRFTTTCAITLGSAMLTLVTAGAQAPLVPVSGVIVDPTGRVLPNVQVSLTDPASASRFEVRSDQAGRYQFTGVPPAAYTLELTLLGFQPASERLRVTTATTRDVSMSVGTLQETITVQGPTDAPDPGDLASSRARAREQFEAIAARGTAPCRASGPPAAGGHIMPPRKLIHVTAAYPQELRASGIGGTVTLTAVIGTDGAVREIADVRGPHPALEAAAAEAVRDWQFSATFLNCEPIDVRMTVTTNFVP